MFDRFGVATRYDKLAANYLASSTCIDHAMAARW
jgi:hypothetical protein